MQLVCITLSKKYSYRLESFLQNLIGTRHNVDRVMVSKVAPSSLLVTAWVWLNYIIASVLGYALDLIERPKKPGGTELTPLLSGFEDFYQRRLYMRVRDCFGRPISSAPSGWFTILETETTSSGQVIRQTGKEIKCLNLSSYNYLGFADNPTDITEQDIKVLYQEGVSTCSYRVDYGTTPLHVKLERRVAEFVGKEDAITCAMGFATNSTMIPSLFGPGTLLCSDSENHASMVAGARSSGAKVLVFPHNNHHELENLLREQIACGMDKKEYKPWKKIVLLIEGIYSMEGIVCNLPEFEKLKKKYKCYLYVDEAHSIGCLGDTGRGICEYWGVKPDDVDMLMGTFTKSFASVGGYLAASKAVVNFLRKKAISQQSLAAMSPVCANQILMAFDLITGRDGTDRGKTKLMQIKDNIKYFRNRLIDMGFEVIGAEGSPVICMMIYYPGKLCLFSRECLKRGLAVVVVGSPATDMVGSRVRYCMSAGHSRDDLIKALAIIEEVGTFCLLQYKK
jgi:serine palmitoyltransferase